MSRSWYQSSCSPSEVTRPAQPTVAKVWNEHSALVADGTEVADFVSFASKLTIPGRLNLHDCDDYTTYIPAAVAPSL